MPQDPVSQNPGPQEAAPKNPAPQDPTPQDPTINWRALESFMFGDNAALADQLAGLVLAGVKTATCWAAAEGLLTQVGKLMVVRDSTGRPLAVIETIELTQRRFDEVDAAFAFDEGENDRSLEGWRRAHQRYFTRLGRFAPDMMLYCERFRVVARLDLPEGACP